MIPTLLAKRGLQNFRFRFSSCKVRYLKVNKIICQKYSKCAGIVIDVVVFCRNDLEARVGFPISLRIKINN